MKNSKFKNDLAIGSIAEKLVIKLFSGCGLKTTPVDASGPNRAFWDLESQSPRHWLLPENSFKTEVKHDVYQHKTGNLAIEVRNSKLDKPSGIYVSKANIWVYVLQDSVWAANLGDLRMFVDTILPKRIIENAGDGNAKIYLYNSKEILSTVFHRIDNILCSEVTGIIHRLCKKKF